MIWGKTDIQRLKEWDTQRLWFAWYPVGLADGRMAWLEHVMCHKISDYDGGMYLYYPTRVKKSKKENVE